MFDPQMLTNGSSFADINAAAVKDRRRQARVNAIEALRFQKADIESRLNTQRRQAALGDGSAGLGIKRNEHRVAELAAQIANATEALARFDAPPADFLDAPKKGAKRDKA